MTAIKTTKKIAANTNCPVLNIFLFLCEFKLSKQTYPMKTRIDAVHKFHAAFGLGINNN